MKIDEKTKKTIIAALQAGILLIAVFAEVRKMAGRQQARLERAAASGKKKK